MASVDDDCERSRELMQQSIGTVTHVLAAAKAWVCVPTVNKKKKKRRKDAGTDHLNARQPAPESLPRLIRRLEAEAVFLTKKMEDERSSVNESHAKSSNLAHLHALYLTARHTPNCTAVFKRFIFHHTPETYENHFISVSGSEDDDDDSTGDEDDDADDAGRAEMDGAASAGVNGLSMADAGSAGGCRGNASSAVGSTRAESSAQSERTHQPHTANGAAPAPAAASAAAAACSSGGRSATRLPASQALAPDALEALLLARLRQDLGDDCDSGGEGEEEHPFSFFGDDGDGDDDGGKNDVLLSHAGTDGEKDSVIVDVVADGGQLWVKVVARNPLSLHRSCQGISYGHRSILAQAVDLLCAARQNKEHFSAPRVAILFAKGVTEAVANRLRALGVLVCAAPTAAEPAAAAAAAGSSLSAEESRQDGPVLMANDPEEAARQIATSPSTLGNRQLCELDTTIARLVGELNLPDAPELSAKINLDVSSMLVLCSELTHGHANYIFQSGVLREQAARERVHPALPELEAFLKGKELVCCRTAQVDFSEIVSTVAGPIEKKRAKELMSRVSIIDDCPSARVFALKESGKIRERSKVIFGTADQLKLTTSTANMAFVRAAAGQGVLFSIFQHESRALTESKQQYATALPADHDPMEADL